MHHFSLLVTRDRSSKSGKGSWWDLDRGGGGGGEKKYGFKERLMVFLAITTTISTFHLATSGSVFLVFRVTYCIEWQ